MGIKSLNEVSESSTKAASYVKSSCMQSEMGNDALLIGLNQNNGIEATRRLAQVQLSPIKTVWYCYIVLLFFVIKIKHFLIGKTAITSRNSKNRPKKIFQI